MHSGKECTQFVQPGKSTQESETPPTEREATEEGSFKNKGGGENRRARSGEKRVSFGRTVFIFEYTQEGGRSKDGKECLSRFW